MFKCEGKASYYPAGFVLNIMGCYVTIGLYTGEEDMTDHKWNLKFSDIDCIEQDINDLSERFLKIEKFVEACIS